MSDSDVVIRVEGLGKKYSLHHEKGERYTALRDVWMRQAKAASRLLNPFTLAGQLRKAQREAAQDRAESEEEFWALKDVSFEIRRGERVGIIGRNGAGKSTLLKILSRITEPTTGRVEIRGRVASLLEVGTGFHPELTGRENIYLNGAILGMTRREIRSKFDEIVDFAEVEKFLDTPVKRYSSGMYVRLAFAVAAHLEPEILVVDEVLAVGDVDFQRKCTSRMQKVSHEGRTVLFVSHNIPSLLNLCKRGLALESGKIINDGTIRDSLDVISTRTATSLLSFKQHIRSSYIIDGWLEDQLGNHISALKMGDPLTVCMQTRSNDLADLAPGFGINNSSGLRVASLNTYMMPAEKHDKGKCGTIWRLTINEQSFLPGLYSIDLSLTKSRIEMIEFLKDCISFEILPIDVYGSGVLPDSTQGVVYLPNANISLAMN